MKKLLSYYESNKMIYNMKHIRKRYYTKAWVSPTIHIYSFHNKKGMKIYIAISVFINGSF